MTRLIRSLCLAASLVWLALSTALPAAADAAFTQWLTTLWPQAGEIGVSRATFDLAIRGLEPDLSLPDLDLPGKQGAPTPGQAEFVQTPADYIKEASIARLAEEGRRLATRHQATLAAIEKQFGVPRDALLALWGREDDVARYHPPQHALPA